MSKVYFTDLRTRPGVNLLDKLEKLVKSAGIESLDCKDKFVAVKIHFGEPGNMAYIRPGYANRLVEILKKLGGKVYLTDSNTLYKGGRSNAVDHTMSAMANGYNPIQVAAPIVIADGIKGTDYADMPVEGGECCKTAMIGRAVADADVIVSLSHFKGHEQAGFGGALKNIGMGAASVGGKLFLHSNSQPFVNQEECRGCGMCTSNCAHGAISISDRKAVIDQSKCVGCGQCVASCLFGAVGYNQDTAIEELNWKIAEYTKAVVQGKPHFHVSLIMDVSPECDCWGHNDAAVAPNIGMAASFDPVALDQACADLVLSAPRLAHGNAIEDAMNGKPGHGREAGHHCDDQHDIFRLIHPDTCWQAAVEHGEKIGLGTREYELVRV